MENLQNRKKSKKCTHAIVQFVKEKKGNKIVADLIPMNWLNEEGDSCFYPKKKQYKYLEEWVKKCKDPEDSWLHSQAVVIMKKCGTYEKGLTHLQKYLDSLDAGNSTTTDELSSDDNNNRKMYVSNILALQTADEAEENSEELKKQSNKKRKREDSNNNDQGGSDTKKVLIQFYTSFIGEMKKTFSSIEYDVDQKLLDVENKVLLNMGRPLGKGLSVELQNLHQTLPIANLTVFKTFDDSLATDANKSTALKNLMRVFGRSKTTIAEAVRGILTQIIQKEVQLGYSGRGKKNSSLEAKENFSATNTFACMCEVIGNLQGNKGIDAKEIQQKTGIWLKGAKDREGGRKTRDSNQE